MTATTQSLIDLFGEADPWFSSPNNGGSDGAVSAAAVVVDCGTDFKRGTVSPLPQRW